MLAEINNEIFFLISKIWKVMAKYENNRKWISIYVEINNYTLWNEAVGFITYNLRSPKHGIDEEN